jgi:ferredoxin--NADP+ reductase
LCGSGKDEQVVVVRNRLEQHARGALAAKPTDERSVLNAGLVLRAIGYRGSPFPGFRSTIAAA